MLSRTIQSIALAVLMLIWTGSFESNAFAQGFDGGGLTAGGGQSVGGGQTSGGFQTTTGGGQTTSGQNAAGLTTGIPTTGSTGSTGGSSNVSNSSQGVGPLGNSIQLADIVDNRNQGFVGATAERIQTSGFVGRPGELMAPPLASGATFGGGVNDSSKSTINIGGGATGGGAAGGGAVGFSPATNGVTITRRSLRSNVRANFSAPQFSGAEVSNRFSDHFVLQPGAQAQPGSYTVNIQDKTAFLQGTVNSAAESERLVRQLRLQPGVYKIVNQLQITN